MVDGDSAVYRAAAFARGGAVTEAYAEYDAETHATEEEEEAYDEDTGWTRSTATSYSKVRRPWAAY